MNHPIVSVLLAVLYLFVAGCSTRPPLAGQLDAGVGAWTYNDALERFGPPEQKQVLADGTVVSRWVMTRPTIYHHQEYDPSASRPVPADPILVREVVELTFGQNQVLESWEVETEDPAFASRTHSVARESAVTDMGPELTTIRP
jgi:hypothetical protein